MIPKPFMKLHTILKWYSVCKSNFSWSLHSEVPYTFNPTFGFTVEIFTGQVYFSQIIPGKQFIF